MDDTHASLPLDDASLQQFIVSGFIQLAPSPLVDAAAHQQIVDDIAACGLQESGGPEDQRAGRRDPYGLKQLDGPAAGNNLLHAAPSLRGPACLEAPALVAALTRLLGPGYRIHPHCRGHLRQHGAKTSMWHVDAYKGLPWCSGRHHEPRWLMIMYYPQQTTADMGPTQLLPGSQYYRGDSDRQHYSRGHIPDFSEQLGGWATVVETVVGPAGTIVVMHYDLWHRALASASPLPRYMLKFVASRTSPPVPSLAPPPRWALAESGSCSGGSSSGSCSGTLAADPLLDFLRADAPTADADEHAPPPPPTTTTPTRRSCRPTCLPAQPAPTAAGWCLGPPGTRRQLQRRSASWPCRTAGLSTC